MTDYDTLLKNCSETSSPSMPSLTCSDIRLAKEAGFDLRSYAGESALTRENYRQIRWDDYLYFYVKRDLLPDLMFGASLSLIAILVATVFFYQKKNFKKTVALYAVVLFLTFISTYIFHVFSDTNPDPAMKAIIVFNSLLSLAVTLLFLINKIFKES